MRRILTFLVFITVFSGIQHAQPAPDITGKVTGKIVDNDNGAPLEFATISIYRSDSSLIDGGISAKDGSFSIDIKPGSYYAVIQFISYEKQYVNEFDIPRGNKVIDLGTIRLRAESTDLEAVTVTAEKSEMVITLDKKVFNVGKDLSNTGQTSLDILDNIPSVTVDLEGNVSLRGSSNLQILINGKPSGMVNAGNTEALQNLQASMVERVEVITNPSARYEAEGMGGIINIVLKKEQQRGVNGTFEVTAGYPHRYSFGTNVNFRREKINYFLNYNIRYGERPGGGYAYQEYNLPDTSYITRLTQDRLRTGMSNRLQGGLDYFINPKNTITGSFILGIDDELNTSDLIYNDYLSDGNTQLYKTMRQDREEEDELDIEFTLNYEKQFSGDEHKLTVYTHYIKDAETEDSDIFESQEYSPSNEMLAYWDTVQTVLNEESERNFLLQADYVYPFGNKGKFETGYRSEFREIDNPYEVREKDADGNWFSLEEYTNNVNYIENVHALYIQAGNQFNRFSVQAGLRGELSDIRIKQKDLAEGDSIIPVSDEPDRETYFDLFPTLHTTYELGKHNALQLSYSRRINRPHFWLLNPFFSYTDPRNIRSGNPNLKPEYTNSYEFGYLFKHDILNFYSGIYFRDTKGVIERVNDVDEATGISIHKPYNLSRRKSYGIEANVTLNAVKWWTLAGDINYYRSMTNGEYDGEKLSSDFYSWNARFNSKMRFEDVLDFQSIFRYRAPSESAQQGRRKAIYLLDMAVSKDILKNKATVTFNVRDVLNSRKFRYTQELPERYSEGEWRRSERTYMVTLIYRLNQKKRRGPQGDRGGNGENGFGGDDIGF